MKTIESYRDLIAWQKSMRLVVMIYQKTKEFPAENKYGLTQQIRRSAVSIPSNIAEGWGRGTFRDYLRFLQIARASAFELSTQVEIAQSLCFSDKLDNILLDIDEIGRVLNGLINAIKKNAKDGSSS